MKITVIAGLPAKRNMKIDASHSDYLILAKLHELDGVQFTLKANRPQSTDIMDIAAKNYILSYFLSQFKQICR